MKEIGRTVALDKPGNTGGKRGALVIAELERIISSEAFGTVERPARFLRHLVETTLRGEADLLKESLVGMQVFDRPPSWDPRLDPVVRQEAARLRKRLARYYASEPDRSAVRIELPVGAYVPVFVPVSEAEPPVLARPAVPEAQTPGQPRAGNRRILYGVAITALAATALTWFLATRRAAAPLAAKSPAEELYLRGLYNWEKRTPESLNKAVDLFTQAIVRDPQYARAYVGLANCYNLLREFSVMPEQDAYPRALAATRKALELDGGSAEAHGSLAFISFWWQWNAAAADREFRQAIDLNPAYANARHWYATFLLARGRFSEALNQIDTAQKLDPSSGSVLADKGLIQYFAGEKEAALALLKQVEAEDATLPSGPRYLSMIYLMERDYRGYVAALKRTAALTKSESARALAAAAEKGFAAGGAQRMFMEVLGAQKDLHARGLLPSYCLAETSAWLGRSSEAVQYLEASAAEPGSLFLGYRIDHAFSGLRADPAFVQLDARFESGIARGTLSPPH